jgi:hypothetical protein
MRKFTYKYNLRIMCVRKKILFEGKITPQVKQIGYHGTGLENLLLI